MVQRIGHGAMKPVCWSDWRDGKVIPAQLVGTAALRDFNPLYDRLGVIRVDSAVSALRPLMLQERRQSGHGNTSRSCHKRTYAVQQTASLFDYLVGDGLKRRRHR